MLSVEHSGKAIAHPISHLAQHGISLYAETLLVTNLVTQLVSGNGPSSCPVEGQLVDGVLRVLALDELKGTARSTVGIGAMHMTRQDFLAVNSPHGCLRNANQEGLG